MKQQKFWEQLARYFAGELSMEKEQEMESWIKENPEREKKIKHLRSVWKESGIPPYRLDVDQAWKLLSSNLDRLEEGQDGVVAEPMQKIGGTGKFSEKFIQLHGKQRSDKFGKVVRRLAITVAAAMILITVGLLGYFNYSSQSGGGEEVSGSQQFVAQQGERSIFTLADGSRVILHAESRLDVPENFGMENRELQLQGEAYFDVEPDSERSFIVHSENAQTTVLGTKFLVQAWPNDSGEVGVVVAEGKVSLRGQFRETGYNGLNEIIVEQDQRGALSAESSPVVTDISEEEIEWYLGWTDGRLVFHDRPLKEIIPKLEQWYVLDIEVEDSTIGERKFSAEIEYSEPMSEVLAAIALSLGLELKKENRSVLFAHKNE